MKTRLDLLLHSQGLAESREKARAFILSGQVFVNGERVDKAGAMVPDDCAVELRGKRLPYVSRGGLKLEKALGVFELSLDGLVCMDVGASTGGFTDCMLQAGAAKVYAIDVGYGQLAWSLRTDPRVVNLERTNFRYLEPGRVPEPVDFASVDVSFISLRLILPVLAGFVRPGGEAVCLVKPQFEAGRDKVGKKGVVRDPLVHRQVLCDMLDFCAGEDSGWNARALDFSPVKGPEGNIEFLLYLTRGQTQSVAPDVLRLDECATVTPADVHAVVEAACTGAV